MSGVVARIAYNLSVRWIPHVFFVLYCLEAGTFLVLAPWTGAWEGFLAYLPIGGLHDLLLAPAVRGAVSGFGLIHLVWGAHDLEYWLARRKYDARLRS